MLIKKLLTKLSTVMKSQNTLKIKYFNKDYKRNVNKNIV